MEEETQPATAVDSLVNKLCFSEGFFLFPTSRIPDGAQAQALMTKMAVLGPADPGTEGLHGGSLLLPSESQT